MSKEDGVVEIQVSQDGKSWMDLLESGVMLYYCPYIRFVRNHDILATYAVVGDRGMMPLARQDASYTLKAALTDPD